VKATADAPGKQSRGWGTTHSVVGKEADTDEFLGWEDAGTWPPALPRVAVRGGAVATAALCAGALVNAAAALRATSRASCTILARVALLRGEVAMASVSVGELVQAAAAMRTAAHAALIIVVRVTFRGTRAVPPAPAQEKRSSPVLGVLVAS